MLRSFVIALCALALSISFSIPVCAQKELELSSPSSAFQPVTVKATVTLSPDDDLVKLAQTDAAAAPAKVVWHWGEQNADKSLVYSEAAWPKGSLTASGSHAYAAPGRYGVMVTVTDTKGRLILQRSRSIVIHAPVEISE